MRESVCRSAGNLPAELTSFVGRRRELKEAKRLLSAARLLTLTGAGGVGKTRLALRVATEVRRAFADGVWLVELAELRDPRLLPSTVATVLGLRDTADPAAGLAEFLRDRQLLLVLDNCEHLVDECAALVTKLLGAGGQLRVLATCRHVLHAEGEHVLRVEPMAVTHDGNPSAAGEPVRATRPSDAVALFVERAGAVLPGVEFTPRDLAVVGQICTRLEGIPLALELAAVRLRVLSVDQLLQRLADRFALLTTGPRAAPARQRTLEATIDWSHDLCSPEEQRLWAQLSVFPGGFDLDAAEHVGDVHDASVLDVLTGLEDKSVLSRQDGTSGKRAWYRMLETVREYAAARLGEQGGEQDVRARQTEHYVALAQRYRDEGFGPRQLEWVGQLRREHANLRAVLNHCLSAPDRASQALDIAASLCNFWYVSGLVHEGYRYLRQGLDLCHDHTTARGRALFAASFLAIQTGAVDTVRDMLPELADLAEELDDDRLRAGHADSMGMVAFFSGALPGAAALLERALTGYRAAGDAQLVFNTLVLLAAVHFFLDTPRGAGAAAEALALTEQHQAHWSRGYAMWAVAVHRWRAGEHGDAVILLREAIALRLADHALLAFLLEALTWCHSTADDHERAARLLGCTTAVWRQSGARVGGTSPYRAVNQQCAEQVRAALGTEAFDTAVTEGAGMGLAETIRYALDEKPINAVRPLAPTSDPGGLTRREHEIAELVARGMNNKDIAAALVISPRTVETHVENILAKLGLTTRTQVAPWLAEQEHRSP
jgi:predicted ATPase/DNA-binding CsgD family transcriptional regulator